VVSDDDTPDFNSEIAGLGDTPGFSGEARTPSMLLIFTLEASSPQVVIEDNDGEDWSRLTHWLISSGQADTLHELLGVLREEPPS